MLSSNNRNKLISLLEHKNYQTAGDSFVIFPDDTDTLARIIKTANRFGIKIVVIGSGSTFDESFKHSESSVFLSTRRLNSVVYVDKTNMFAEFQAGCIWKTEFGNLVSEGITFPVDMNTMEDKRTFGGIFSSLKQNSHVTNYFTGIEFITADGSLIRYGSRTLKNVAGYDLIKFMAGSMGKFGVITSLTLRLFPSEDEFSKTEELKDITDQFNRTFEKRIYRNLIGELDPNGVFQIQDV